MEKLLPRKRFNDMKVIQYEAIPIVKDMECPECHKSDVNGTPPLIYARPVGWCDTPSGYIAVFECPKCFSKFRCHINTNGRYSDYNFYQDFALMFYLYNNRNNYDTRRNNKQNQREV